MQKGRISWINMRFEVSKAELFHRVETKLPTIFPFIILKLALTQITNTLTIGQYNERVQLHDLAATVENLEMRFPRT